MTAADTPTIARLRARATETQVAHAEAIRELNAVLIEASPYREGMEVEVTSYGKPWTRALVSRVGVRYDTVRIWVRVATKTGWHKTEREIWSFTQIRPSEATT